MKTLAFFQDRRIRTSLLGIGTDLLLSALKIVLAVVTGSAALLADAYHSGADLIVSLLLFVGLAIRFYSDRSKSAESNSNIARKVEAGLGLFVSLIILYVPYQLVSGLKDQSPEDLTHLWIGIAGVVLIMGILIFISRLKSHVGKATDSIALEADGYHSYLDLFTTAAVLFSLIGMMVGIYLDEIVAIIISILIAVAGLELLLSSLRSLIKKDDLEQISLIQAVGSLVARIPLGTAVIAAYLSITQFLRRYRVVFAAAILGAYLISGFRVVPFGHEGLKLRFERQIGSTLAPGLHFALPRPIDRIEMIPVGSVRQVEAGSRVALQDSQADTRLWRELPTVSNLQDEADYLATADESLIDLRFQLFYRVANTPALYPLAQDVDQLVVNYLQGALWEQVALTTYDNITDRTQHSVLSQRVSDRMVERAAELGIEVQVIGAYIESVQPPATVVTTYRDLINADQERQQRINVAIAESLQNLPDARAQISADLAGSRADAYEKKLSAESEGMLITSLSDIHRDHKEAFEFNARLDALVGSLRDRNLTVVDSKIDPRTLEAWNSYDAQR